MIRTAQERVAFLNGLLGKPYQEGNTPDAFDCYRLWMHVRRELFGVDEPLIETPERYDMKWTMRTIQDQMRQGGWKEIEPHPVFGAINLPDGATALMAGSRAFHHLGIWLKKERGVIHTDKPDGVVITPLHLLCAIWPRIVFLRQCS